MATDIFLKLDGVDGESSDSAHEKEIDVLSWSWGMNQSGTMHIAKGGGAGKANVGDMQLTKHIDAATANLMKYCCSGKQFPSAILVCRKAGDTPVEYYKIEMKNVIISSVQVGGAQSDDRLIETVSLNFGEYASTYTPQDNEGKPGAAIGPAGYNMQTNKAV
jgi:type VI secretion system secreted protein Hcp